MNPEIKTTTSQAKTPEMEPPWFSFGAAWTLLSVLPNGTISYVRRCYNIHSHKTSCNFIRIRYTYMYKQYFKRKQDEIWQANTYKYIPT